MGTDVIWARELRVLTGIRREVRAEGRARDRERGQDQAGWDGRTIGIGYSRY